MTKNEEQHAMMFSADSARVANYVCTALSLLILLLRLIVARWSQKPFDATFLLVIVSILFVVTRVIVNYFYLKYGTASDALSNAKYFNTHDPATIKAGTILSLVSRVILALCIWLQNSILLLWYSQLIYGIVWVRRMIKICWFTMGATFIAVVLSTFLECHPFHKYYQLQPNPGQCVKAYIQLLIQGISNIVLDLMLLVIAFPLLAVSNRTLSQHIRVGALFLVGTFCIIVTILRVTAIFQQGSAQPTRSLWASIQLLVSVFVANVPSIYGTFKVTKRKKSEPLIRRRSRADGSISMNVEEAAPVPTLPIYREDQILEARNLSISSKVWTKHEENVT